MNFPFANAPCCIGIALVVAVAACSDDGGGARDARIDATIDAGAWPCEPKPPAMPSASSTNAAVVFDTPIPLLPENDFGAVETFYDGTQIIVATTRELHFVSLDGVLERSLLLALPSLAPPNGASIHDIAMGNGTFGSVMVSLTGPSWFCLIDPNTGIDESICTPLRGQDARVVVDGEGYAVYEHQYRKDEYPLYRWRFDATGSLIDEIELWNDLSTSRYLLNAASGPGGMLIATRGYEYQELHAHRVNGVSHTVENVRPPTLAYAGGLVLREWSGDAHDALGFATHVRCPEVADDQYALRMTILTRFDLETVDVGVTPLPLRFLAAGALMLDGGDTAIAYAGGFDDMRISRFDSNGSALDSEVRLPLSYENTGIELQFVGAGRAIGPGDYVFVYSGTGDVTDRRVARITLPP